MKQISERSGLSFSHRPETLEFHRSAIGKAVHLMRHDPGATLDWNALAETACMSRYHFLRIFEGLTRVSPHRFLIALRMEKAKQLLLETVLDVNDICLAVGYTSVGTFIRVFKELVGIAPGGFRNLAEKLTQPALQLLLAENLDRRKHLDAGRTLRVDLQVSEPFAGVIFVGPFNSQLQPLIPLAGTVVRESRSVHLPVAGVSKEACLLAVGFLDSMTVDQYFLPGRHSPAAISSLLPAAAFGLPDPKIVALNLQVPNIFDVPVLFCLPLLLLRLAEAECIV